MNPGVAVTNSATQIGHNLLMRWCAPTATAPNAIEHPYFQAYVAFVSNQCHKAPTRYCLMLALTRLLGRVRSSMTFQLKRSAYLGVQLDGWSSGGRHLAAMCTSVPGEQFLANAYENWREDTAANSAVAANACLSDLLEVSPGARRPLQ
jgi:hypothetical protein